jgi:4,5-epoxidase
LATTVLRGTSNVTRVNIVSNPVGRFVRDRIVVRLVGLPVIQRWATYSASQLWVSYRKGPLGGRGRRPRAGDRVADLPCVRADGASSWLHTELGGRWALMVSQDSPVQRVAAEWLGDRVGVLRYDVKEAMLVRPDAHLAWRGAIDDNRGLDRWLSNALRHGRAGR